MSNPSLTTTAIPDEARPLHPTRQRGRWSESPLQRDHLILLIITALILGGCHARSGCCHSQSSCDTAAGDDVIAAFYLFYILGWIIVSAAER